MAGKKAVDILADRVKRLACAKCGSHIDLSSVDPFDEVACPECGTKQVAPMRLGSFLLLAEMGKGGMGSVFRAYDQTLGRYVAIKVMQKHLAADKKFADNFLREARAAAALNHSNVVQIYSCGQEQGQLYIVMELVSGGRLDEMIEGGKALDEVFTLEVGVQVAKGLQAANEIGLVHGDIKPANILFDKQRQAKVVDFGLARFAAQQHLQPGEIWGTPYYIAPEKVRSQQEDQRADIYSLGATLFHVLAGQPPFDGDTAKEVVIARLKGPAPGLQTLRPTLQPETVDVIARTLEAEPTRRYPTYTSLLADLEEALRWAREREGLPPKNDKAGGHKLGWIAGAAVFLALIAGGFYFLGQDEPDAPPPAPPPIVTETTEPADEDPAPPSDVPTEADIIYAVQPFNPEVQQAIRNAVTAWMEGRAANYEQQLSDIFRDLPRLGVERPWIGVLQAIPSWWAGNESAVLRHLRGIQDARLRELEDDAPHPGIMPQSLARFMLGQIDEPELQSVAEAWPDWFADLGTYLAGIRHLQAGRLDEALTRWESYLGKSANADARWPYAFQPHATEWRDRIRNWKETERSAAGQDPEAAQQTLSAFRARAPAQFHQAIDAALAQARQRAEAAEREQQAAAQAAQQARIAEEIARIDEVREALFEHVESRDFRRAAAQLRQQVSTPETAEARAYRERVLESYNRMEDLRRFIVDRIQAAPVSQHELPRLGSDTLGASLTGIEFRLGDHGSMMRTWDQINVRLFAELAEHYIEQLPSDEQADRWLSLAVFAYQNRGLRPARTYADRALELEEALRSDAVALMPDLEWE